jgi:hypothetical protein
MTRPGDIPMTRVRFESEPGAEAQHILDITGIEPDRRLQSGFPHAPGVPRSEMEDMIKGAQDKDPVSGAALIATRLFWIYRYAQDDIIKARWDLSIGDFMQLGSMATLAAAVELDASRPNLTSLLNADTRKLIERNLLSEKLLPAVNSTGNVTHEIRHKEEIPDEIVLLGTDRILEVSGETLPEVGIGFLIQYAGLTDKQAKVMIARFGTKGHKGLREVGEEFGISHQAASRLERRALEKMKDAAASLSEDFGLF